MDSFSVYGEQFTSRLEFLHRRPNLSQLWSIQPDSCYSSHFILDAKMAFRASALMGLLRLFLASL